jgi:hypothetical protein
MTINKSINKYIFLLILIFIIICIIFFFIYFINTILKGNNINNNNNNKQQKENFQNKMLENYGIKTNNNLIGNGNFHNGFVSPNYINHNGYNKIIMKQNPGSSSYVLEQKRTNELTYYEFMCKNVKNSKYILYFWLSIDKKDIETMNFEKIIRIKIQKIDFSNDIPKLNYNIIQKVVLSNGDIWYYIKYYFISDNNSTDKMQLYLNYSIDLQYNTFYFTEISLYRILIDAENFIFNDNLLCYVDTYKYESNNTTWRDLSGIGNNLFLSNIPTTDYTKGSMQIENIKITGFPSNKISNDTFSILFCFNKYSLNNHSLNDLDKNDLDKDSNDDDNDNASITDFYLLSLSGNERYSFEIKLKDNFLYVICDENIYKSKNEIILYNKSLLSIQYNKGILYIIHDGIIVLKQKIRKVYFNENHFIINKNMNKNIQYNFYSILFYNRFIEINELNEIREYFITNKNKDFENIDINDYHMNLTANYTHDKTNKTEEIPLKSFHNKLVQNENIQNDVFKEVFDNQNIKFNSNNNSYNSDCFKNCFNTMDNLSSCIDSCKVSPETEEYDQLFYKHNDNDNDDNNNDKIKCPKVYMKNGKFIVYIPPNSYYAEKLNYSGEKSYGTNIDKARYTYNLNFPKCPIPNELILGSENKYMDTCPFVIHELNPCVVSSCSNVNWNVSDVNDLNLNKKCKKAVSNYCQINYNLDDSCIHWHPKNKHNKKSIEYRRYFEDPKDYCSPSQFKIEDHPDFDKYIKKDNIPCWGCNLET